VRARPARTDAFLWPERVPRGIGRLPFAGQVRDERVTAAGCGGLTSQNAVVSLMCGHRLMRRYRLIRGAYRNGWAELS